MSFPDHTVCEFMSWELYAFKSGPLAVMVTVAVRNTALLCMLDLVTEASLSPCHRREHKEISRHEMSVPEVRVLHMEGPSALSVENVWDVVTTHLKGCSHKGLGCQWCAAHRAG